MKYKKKLIFASAISYIEPIVPIAPVLSSSSIDYNLFLVEWSHVQYATYYQLSVATDVNFTNIINGYNDLNVGYVNSYEVINLNPETTYFVKLKSCNYKGNGTYSDVLQITTLAEPIPSAVVLNEASNITGGSFMVSWSTTAYVTKYLLDIALDSNFNTYVSGYQNLDCGTNTQYNVQGIDFNTTYYVRVKAVNSQNQGNYSNTISVLTLAGANPDTPNALSPTQITFNSFTANWQTTNNADTYYLQVSDAIDFSTLVLSQNVGNVLSYDVTNLQPSTDYYYRVKGVNAFGESSYSSIISLTTSSELPNLLAAHFVADDLTSASGTWINRINGGFNLSYSGSGLLNDANFNNHKTLSLGTTHAGGWVNNISITSNDSITIFTVFKPNNYFNSSYYNGIFAIKRNPDVDGTIFIRHYNKNSSANYNFYSQYLGTWNLGSVDTSLSPVIFVSTLNRTTNIAKLFKNGVLLRQITSAIPSDYPFNGNDIAFFCNIGGTALSNNDAIAEYRIYIRELTDSEILEVVNELKTFYNI